MEQPLSRRSVTAVATTAFSLSLAAVVCPPALSGASTHSQRAQVHGALINVESSKTYGKILVNASGRVLYYLSSETARSMKCSGSCTHVFLPLFTGGQPRAGAGVIAKELGEVKRGSAMQVTYYGHPLYLYSGDHSAGQTNGEGITAFGGKWYILHGSSVNVTMPPAPGATMPPAPPAGG